MPTTIPGAPNDGGALASYLDSYLDEIGWMASPEAGTSKEIAAALQDTLNDPNNWFAYAANSLQTVWNSLPEEVRQEAQIAIGQLIDLGLRNLGTVATNALATTVSSMADIIPLIGAIIDVLITTIQDFIELGKQIETKRENTAAGHFMDSSRWTVEQYDDPNDWVMKRAKVVNFLDRHEGKWRVRPSFGRSGGSSDRMFYSSSGPSDSGFCGAGVRMDCGLASYQSMATCEKHDPNDPYCKRHVPLSCLFYPFYSPAYPDYTAVTEWARLTGGWGETGGKITYTPVTANSILMSRQMALLSSPSVNLRVDAKRLLKFRDRFVNYFYSMANAFAPENVGKTPNPKYFGVLPINKHHIMQRVPVEERLSIDLEKIPGAGLGSKDQNKFYFDAYGLIHPYHTADLNAWGVIALAGPQTPKDAAVSCAQYNTIVSATLSFMSARANFLRNGPMMRALLQDFNVSDFDKRVRSAMKYSAEVGEKLPQPSRARPTPTRPLPARLIAVPALPSGLLPSGPDVALPPASPSENDRLTRNEAAMLAVAAGGIAAWKGPEFVRSVRKKKGKPMKKSTRNLLLGLGAAAVVGGVVYTMTKDEPPKRRKVPVWSDAVAEKATAAMQEHYQQMVETYEQLGQEGVPPSDENMHIGLAGYAGNELFPQWEWPTTESQRSEFLVDEKRKPIVGTWYKLFDLARKFEPVSVGSIMLP